MHVECRVFHARGCILALEGSNMGEIFIHGTRNDVEMQTLSHARLLEHVEAEAFGGGIGQPFIDGQAIALGLGNLLALGVEEQFIDIMLGRRAAQNGANPIIDYLIGLVILAEHLEIDAKGSPAHAEIGLPLQLHIAAGDRQCGVAPILIGEGDRAIPGIDLFHRHIKDAPRYRGNRQEGRIGRLPLGPKGGQHHLHDVVIALGGAQQHGVELAAAVIFGGAGEFVVEAERVEEAAQHGVIVLAETGIFIGPGIGHRGQRLLQMRLHGLFGRHGIGNLAHAVEIVGETDQPGRDLIARQQAEGGAHHGGAGHFAKGADMGQARRAITGLEQSFALARLFQPFDELARFLERPGARILRGLEKGGVKGGQSGGRHGCSSLSGQRRE